MKISFPIEAESFDELYKNNETGNGGFYPVSTYNMWHGGIHLYGFDGSSQSSEVSPNAFSFGYDKWLKYQTTPIYAIADGEVIAYRISEKQQQDVILGDPFYYTNSFVLLKHKYVLKTKKIIFYSLYMHLLPWEFYSDNGILPEKSPFYTTIPKYIVDTEINGEGIPLYPETNDPLQPGKRVPLMLRIIPKGTYIEELEPPNNLPEDHWKKKDPRNEGFKYINIPSAGIRGYAGLQGYSEPTGISENVKQIAGKNKFTSPEQYTTFGLNLYKEANEHSEVLRIIPKGEEIFLKNPNEYKNNRKGFYQLVKKENSDDTIGFIYNDGNSIKIGKKERTNITFDSVITPNPPEPIKSGDTIGYTGRYDQSDFFHLEVFTKNIDFMKYKKDDEEPIEYFIAKPGAVFLKKVSTADEESCNLPKHSILKILEGDSLNEGDFCKVRLVSRRLWVKKNADGYISWNGELWDVNKIIDKAYVSIPQSGAAEPDYHVANNAVGSCVVCFDWTSDTDYKLVQLTLSQEPEKWVQYNREIFDYDRTSNKLTVEKNLDVWYDSDPNQYTFEGTAFEVEEQIAIDKNKVQELKIENEIWYGVKEAGNDETVGWIKKEANNKFELLDCHEWKKFFKKVNKKKEIIKIIESCKGNEKDSELTCKELQNALSDSNIASELRYLVVQHPTEWSVDANEQSGYWKGLQSPSNNWTKKQIDDEIKPHSKKLGWYDEIRETCSLPDPMKLYYFHPIAFIEHLKKIFSELDLLMEKERLSVKEIQRARILIKELTIPQRKPYYLELQKKVNYKNQRNNTSIGERLTGEIGSIGYIMCNLTCLAMTLEYLGVENPDSTMQFEDFLEDRRVDQGYDERWLATSWVDLANSFEIDSEEIQLQTTNAEIIKSKLQVEMESGNGVVLSVFTGDAGHIVRLQEITDEGIVVDDPNGKVDIEDRQAMGEGTGWWGYKAGETRNSDDSESGLGEDNLWIWSEIAKTTVKYAYSFKRKPNSEY